MSESLKLHLPTYKLKDPDNIDHIMRSISLAAQQVNIYNGIYHKILCNEE